MSFGNDGAQLRVKDGRYPAIAQSYDFGRTDNDNDYVRVAFQIVGERASGETVFWDGYFTQKTTERTLESLKYAGWSGRQFTKLEGLGSKECQIVVKNERSEQDGKWYPRVQWVNDPGGGGVKLKRPLQDIEKQELESRIAAFMDSSNGPPPASSGPGPVSYGDEPPW